MSEADRKFIELQTPPRVEISASKVKEDTNIFARFRSVEKEEVQVSAKIRKSSSAPYSGELTAILLVIGQNTRTDNYVVLDNTKSAFTFSSENSNTHEFSSPEIRLAHSGTDYEFGGEYEGYLVGILGSDKQLIAAKGSRNIFEENAEEFITLKRGAVFDKDGNVGKGRRGVEKMKKDVRDSQRIAPPPPKKKFFSRRKPRK